MTPSDVILVGDIGGTKTILALYEVSPGFVRGLAETTFLSREHATFEEILKSFLRRERPNVRAVCLGVAGPVVCGRSRTTNLPWVLDERTISEIVGTPRVRLLNDLEAAACGMLHLGPDELEVLNAGSTPVRKGIVAVIAAGTGLGEAIVYWDGQKHHPSASEGGHCDFAPRGEQEIALLRYLAARFDGHVSYERVLSGPGLLNVYSFLRNTDQTPEPPWLADRLMTGDPSASITQAALAGEDPVCVAALDLFVSIYGAEAGNLALKAVAVGGVFVGGGIAPKILPALRREIFMKAFTGKGRFAPLLQDMRVCVSLNPRAPLIGAAHFAAGI